MEYKSKFDKEIKKRKELAEAEEYVKQVEKPTGRKYVIDTLKEEEKKVQDFGDTVKSVLEGKKQQHISYRSDLAKYGNWLLEEIKQDGWEQEFVPTSGTRIKIYSKWFDTEEGVLLIIKDPKNNVYVRGIRTVYVPEYDEAGIKTLVVQSENTIDSYKGLLLSDARRNKRKIH